METEKNVKMLRKHVCYDCYSKAGCEKKEDKMILCCPKCVNYTLYGSVNAPL